MGLLKTAILLDTNILIEIVNNPQSIDLLPPEGDYCMSAVSVMELFALAGMSETEERKIGILLRALHVLPFTASTAARAGRLARTRRPGRPDLMIAATAIEYDIPLITKNVKDFKKIPGLEVRSAV